MSSPEVASPKRQIGMRVPPPLRPKPKSPTKRAHQSTVKGLPEKDRLQETREKAKMLFNAVEEDLERLEATFIAKGWAKAAKANAAPPKDSKKGAVVAEPQAMQHMAREEEESEVWLDWPQTKKTAVRRSPWPSPSTRWNDWGWSWTSGWKDYRSWNSQTEWSEWSDSDWGDWSPSMAQPVKAGLAEEARQDSEMEDVIADLPEEFCELTNIGDETTNK